MNRHHPTVGRGPAAPHRFAPRYVYGDGYLRREMAMSDTALIAGITGASTLIGATISGTLSYLTAKGSTKVQLKGIEAEMQRLQASHLEEERRNRKDVYLSYLAIVDQLCMALGCSGELDKARYDALAAEYSLAHAKMLLFAAEAVIEAMDPITEGLEEAGSELPSHLDAKDKSFADYAREAYTPYHHQIVGGQGLLIVAMKQELGGHRFREEIEREYAKKSAVASE